MNYPIIEHITSMKTCMESCNDEIQKFQEIKNKAVNKIIFSYLPKFQKLGGVRILAQMKAGKTLEALQDLNVLLTKPETRQVLMSLIGDMTNIYKDNNDHLNAIIDCLFTKCNSDAIKLIYEFVQVVANVYKLLITSEMEAKSKELQHQMVDTLEYIIDRFKKAIESNKSKLTTAKR